MSEFLCPACRKQAAPPATTQALALISCEHCGHTAPKWLFFSVQPYIPATGRTANKLRQAQDNEAAEVRARLRGPGVWPEPHHPRPNNHELINRGLRALDAVKHCQDEMTEAMRINDAVMRKTTPLDWAEDSVLLAERAARLINT